MFLEAGIKKPNMDQNLTHTALTQIMDFPYESPKEQFLLLSSISNFHKFGYPSISEFTSKSIITPSHVSYAEHVLYDPFSKEDMDGNNIRKYIPVSPRNRIMYFLSTFKESEMYHILHFLLSKDQGTDDPPIDYEQPEIPRQRKKRKHSSRLVSVTHRAILSQVGGDINIQLNCANPSRTIYAIFVEQLLTEGCIKWRQHESNVDICLINDYNPTTEYLMPQSFIHVSCTNEDGSQFIRCTCKIYDIIQRAAKQETPLSPGEESVPDTTLTCMHCRFYKEHLNNVYERISTEPQGSLPRALRMVHESIQYMNDPVQVVGSVIDQGTTRFSCKGTESHSLIHLSFYNKTCQVKCMDGICAANFKNRKNITKRDTDHQATKMCSHLRTLFSHFAYVKAFFPDYFNDASDEIQEEDQIIVGAPDTYPLNNEDANLQKSLLGHFDVTSGLWKYPALSTHKPKEMHDPDIVNSTQHRNDYISSSKLDHSTGLYTGYILKPSPLNAAGQLKPCDCGSTYSEEGAYVGKGTVYTRMGPLEVKYYDTMCEMGTCKIPYTQAAEEKGIFLKTTQTGAGDEIGWDFIELVRKTKSSFSSYCNELIRRYQTTNIYSGPFMSDNTFISWFFAWLAAFKIDFRKEVDPWCQYKPPILACDGTHIGVSVRNMKLDKPVTMPDIKDGALKPMHKRGNRVILRDAGARRHLKYLSKKYLKKLKPSEILQPELEREKTREMLQIASRITPPPFYESLLIFTEKAMHDDMLHVLARLYYMLSGDAAMSTVAPFECHDLLAVCYDSALVGQPSQKDLQELKTYSVELAQIIIFGITHKCQQFVKDFCKCLVDEIRRVHQNNRACPAVNPVPNSYNPSSGTAYYFTPTGDQLRKLPMYEVCAENKEKNNNFDDFPEVDQACRKMFPSTARSGFGYLFLWFCPVHGHSYGFHLISGGEGRKDPFCSLFKYCETMPQHIYYDFACQLSEYCLNREPELFKSTRFWHDLFHFIGHLCGINFKSGRVLGLEGVNTEICEQVNSFLQCIKYTGSHLSQDHFTFFLQFFLYLMNKEKTKNFQKLASIAIAGQL